MIKLASKLLLASLLLTAITLFVGRFDCHTQLQCLFGTDLRGWPMGYFSLGWSGAGTNYPAVFSLGHFLVDWALMVAVSGLAYIIVHKLKARGHERKHPKSP